MNMNPFLARFHDQQALVAQQSHILFTASLQKTIQIYAEIETKLSASKASDDDFWGDNPDNAWIRRWRPYVVRDGILQIPVKGVLLHDFPYALGPWATGYAYIWRAFERGMGDDNVKGIALVVDSPGGMVAGCFEMVDKMWGLKGKKPIWGFASEAAYSAAYATISVADKIVVTRTGGVGSIGVVTMHVDVSKAMDEYGYKITYIFAGKHKVDGNPYEALSEETKARIQARIDTLYSVFVSSVARNRNLAEDAVRATEALTYGAAESLSVGLADEIGALDDALADFSASLTLEEGDETMADYTKAQYDEAVAAARTEGETAGKTAGIKEGSAEARTRIGAILASDEGKVRPKAAMSLALKSDMPAEAVSAILADMDEEKAEAAPAVTGAGAGAGVGKEVFDAAMGNTGNPEVGAGSEKGKVDDDDADIEMSFSGRKSRKAA